jgi:hypothetical protein
MLSNGETEFPACQHRFDGFVALREIGLCESTERQTMGGPRHNGYLNKPTNARQLANPQE